MYALVPFSLESIEPSTAVSQERVDTSTLLKCQVRGFPRPHITWERFDKNTLQVNVLEEDGRIVIENHSTPTELDQESQIIPTDQSTDGEVMVSNVQSVLTFKSLKSSDNGTYICKATGHSNFYSKFIEQRPLTTRFTVIVLEPPQIHIDKVEIDNKTTALLSFVIDHHGNAPIVEFPIELVNYTAPNASWVLIADAQRVDNNNNTTSSIVLKVDNLNAGANYGFRLAARNELGQSDWSYMNISLPPDVPSVITNVHLLTKTSEKLIFGFTRPSHDNGVHVNLYQFLFTSGENRLRWNVTVSDLNNGNSANPKSKIMYVIPNLSPAKKYIFQVSACSNLGCGEFSSPLEVYTSDGQATPPLNVQLNCNFNTQLGVTNGIITWNAPASPAGNITGYNISLEGFANFRGANNRTLLEEFNEHYIYKIGNNNITAPLEHRLMLRANTNYTVRVAGINNAGSGQFSPITSNSICESAPKPLAKIEKPQFKRLNITETLHNGSVLITPFVSINKLLLLVPRVSERNGRIQCYRIVIVRLAKHEEGGKQNINLNFEPSEFKLNTYAAAHDHKHEKETMAYIAEEFSTDELPIQVMIGDGQSSRCYADAPEYDIQSRVQLVTSAVVTQSRVQLATSPTVTDNRTLRRISDDGKFVAPKDLSNSSQNTFYSPVNDSQLWPDATYTAFIEVTVLSANRTLLISRGELAEPIETKYIELNISNHYFPNFNDMFEMFIGFVLIILVILMLRFAVKRIKRTRKINKTARDFMELRFRQQAYSGEDDDEDMIIYQKSPKQATDKLSNKPIPLNQLAEAYMTKHENDDALFKVEFSQLPNNFYDRTTLVSSAPENILKNRYPEIKCYDQTRVLLSKEVNGELSDYINADHVISYDKRFICAQSPLNQTIDDFWRMIYEQECK